MITSERPSPALLGPAPWMSLLPIQVAVYLVLGALIGTIMVIVAGTPWFFGHAVWQLTLSFVVTFVKLAVTLVMAVVMALTLTLSISSATNNYDRTHGKSGPGFTLPRVIVIMRDVNAPVHIFFAGIFPTGQMMYAGNRDVVRDGVNPRSSIAGLAQTGNLVFIEYPKYGLDEATAFQYIIDELRRHGLLEPGGPRRFRLWTESYGSMVGERFRLWNAEQPPEDQIGPLRGYGIFFPLPNADYLEPGLRVAMTYQAICTGGDPAEWIWKHGLSDVVAPASKAQLKRAQEGGWLDQYYAERDDLNAYPGNLFANSIAILRGDVFDGPAETPDYPVTIFNVPDGHDPLLRTDRIMRLMKKKFPNAQVVGDLPGEHGMLLPYAEEFRAVVDAAEAANLAYELAA